MIAQGNGRKLCKHEHVARARPAGGRAGPDTRTFLWACCVANWGDLSTPKKLVYRQHLYGACRADLPPGGLEINLVEVFPQK
jgi:hypothetical protein